jgi:hypothetical protein
MPIVLAQNTSLNAAATGGSTGTVCEPTAAANGNQLMVTGNWFASTSNNSGTAWAFVSPFTRFPPAAGGFCCDQVVLHNPGHKIWIWLLQYIAPTGGSNIFRLAVCKDSNFGNWHFWDVAPKNLNPAWTTLWFDYPDMAFTNDKLFITFNAFIGNAWQRSVVFRFPLATLAAAGSLSYQWWTTTNNGSIRLCRGGGPVMYMGSHNNSFSQIRLFQWADSAPAMGPSKDINVHAWSGTRGAYSAPGPDGVNWLLRTDGRITGAWVGAGVIGFMWSANRDANHPRPYIRVVRIKESTQALVDEPDIWSSTSAWAYPAAAANGQGVAGFSAFIGGGTRFPSHVVGVKTATGWDTQLTKAGTHDPNDQSWGDYLSCTPHSTQPNEWVASGYTLQGGGGRANVEPRFVHFK